MRITRVIAKTTNRSLEPSIWPAKEETFLRTGVIAICTTTPAIKAPIIFMTLRP